MELILDDAGHRKRLKSYLKKSKQTLGCDESSCDSLFKGPPHAYGTEMSKVKVADESAGMWVLRCGYY